MISLLYTYQYGGRYSRNALSHRSSRIAFYAPRSCALSQCCRYCGHFQGAVSRARGWYVLCLWSVHSPPLMNNVTTDAVTWSDATCGAVT